MKSRSTVLPMSRSAERKLCIRSATDGSSDTAMSGNMRQIPNTPLYFLYHCKSRSVLERPNTPWPYISRRLAIDGGKLPCAAAGFCTCTHVTNVIIFLVTLHKVLTYLHKLRRLSAPFWRHDCTCNSGGLATGSRRLRARRMT